MRIVKNSPTQCPVCGSDNYELDKGLASYDCREYFRCLDCGAVCVDRYEYVETEVYTKEEWEG